MCHHSTGYFEDIRIVKIILFSNITSSKHKTRYLSVVSAFMKEIVSLSITVTATWTKKALLMSNLIIRSVWLLFLPFPCSDQTWFDDTSYLFLGKGSFASTYKAIYESKNVCVKRLHPTLDKEHVATLSKEEEIIQRINNSHVVKLRAVSDNPITIMMEFCAFSFTPFNRDATVNSLDEFLSYYDQEDLHCFFPTILHKISSDATKAVQYIHSDNIVHRDIKPANILVSNMHYNNLTDARETANIFKSGPIICKLADLGEAQSKLLQTRVISNNSRAHFVRRGSPAYIAPEILVEESILKSAGIE